MKATSSSSGVACPCASGRCPCKCNKDPLQEDDAWAKSKCERPQVSAFSLSTQPTYRVPPGINVGQGGGVRGASHAVEPAGFGFGSTGPTVEPTGFGSWPPQETPGGLGDFGGGGPGGDPGGGHGGGGGRRFGDVPKHAQEITTQTTLFDEKTATLPRYAYDGEIRGFTWRSDTLDYWLSKCPDARPWLRWVESSDQR